MNKKSYLFPEATKAHYSVCLSVSGDELLIMDPNPELGGVYYVDCKRVYAGMDTYSELIGGKRGYIVMAHNGTPAFERIKEGIIYTDKRSYMKLKQNIRKKVDKLFETVSIIEDVMPKQVREFIDKTNKAEKVSRVWNPDKIRNTNH